MTLADILIWQTTNGLLLIPAAIAVLIVLRRIRGRRAFTDRDWLFSRGELKQTLFSVHVWLRFSVLWFTVVLTGVVGGYVLLPFAMAAFAGAFILAVLVLRRVVPKSLKLNR